MRRRMGSDVEDMGVDDMGVDDMGVDDMGVDDMGVDDMATKSTLVVMPALVAGIHVFLAAAQQARRGWPGHKRVHARLRRAMPGHDGAEKQFKIERFTSSTTPRSDQRASALK